MKILLIYPPRINCANIMLLKSIEQHLGQKAPLGIMYIASYLLKNSAHQVFLLDAQARGLSSQQVFEEVKNIDPQLIGITTITDFWYETFSLITMIKRFNPEIHICLGGPHVNVFPEITLKFSGADSIILGDGETPFYHLAERLSRQEDLDGIEGLSLKDEARSKEKGYFICEDLDSLPFPARELLPYRRYTSMLGKGRFVTTMVTSRGCPCQCTFCKLQYQKTQLRSPDNVVGEIESIYNLGIREIELYDDTFGISKKRVIEICKGIIKKGINIIWSCRDRVSNIDQETITYMKRAGCRRIHLGIESGSDKVLRNIKKGITTREAKEAVTAAKKAGLEVLTYFMLGLPGETKEEIWKTFDFAKELDPDYVTFSVTVPYPGTELYREALERRIIPSDFWREFAVRPKPDFQLPYYFEEHFSKRDLLELRNTMVKRFYFRKEYILKKIFKRNTPAELYRKFLTAVSLFSETAISKGH